MMSGAGRTDPAYKRLTPDMRIPENRREIEEGRNYSMKYIETFREGAHISVQDKADRTDEKRKGVWLSDPPGQDGDRRREDLGAEFSGDQ